MFSIVMQLFNTQLFVFNQINTTYTYNYIQK